jgi:hypothetical protein
MSAPTKPEPAALLQRLMDEPTPVPKADLAGGDELYLRVWELEQTNTNTRWTITTFFMSVSFAIFGFSFQAGLDNALALSARLGGLAIYWFAYRLFLRFHAYTEMLRRYLYECEQQGVTRIRVQERAQQLLRSLQPSSRELLRLLGLAYTIGVALLWWFG